VYKFSMLELISLFLGLQYTDWENELGRQSTAKAG
jgi:hypothetical protein